MLFNRLDVAQAYLQLNVTDQSAEAQTNITHRGAFRVKRLQFGTEVAPGIFQQVMKDLLGNIEGVVPYFDDVLIYVPSLQILYQKLRDVLQRFRNEGFSCKEGQLSFWSRVDRILSLQNRCIRSSISVFIHQWNNYQQFMTPKPQKTEQNCKHS